MTSPFDCSTCGCPVHKHTVKMWPSFTRFCVCGNCGTGYLPEYRNKGNN